MVLHHVSAVTLTTGQLMPSCPNSSTNHVSAYWTDDAIVVLQIMSVP